MPANHSQVYDALIVGAGLAGLAAAIPLHEAGWRILLVDKSNKVGGRLRTDLVDGFRLDHGFQVMLTAYEECQALLDYEALKLGRFDPGALLWTGEKLEVVADPIRSPSLILPTLRSSVGTFFDKLRIAKLKHQLSKKTIDAIYEMPESSALQSLKKRGFSSSMIEGFFRPFFRGIFLEPELRSSNRMLDFVFKSFGQGYAALPNEGMASIPKQLSQRLPDHAFLLGQAVEALLPQGVMTQSGQELRAKHIILATDMSEASRLSSAVNDRSWNGTRCYYFEATQSPLSLPMIALNASGRGVIESVCVPSDISPGYAPSGRSLICVNSGGNSELNQTAIEEELLRWFGASVEGFKFIRSYSVPQALPRQEPGDLAFGKAALRDDQGVWLCGDHRFSSSIEGALKSGRLVAEALLQES